MVPRRPALLLLLDRPALTADPVPDCKPLGVRSIETPPG
nr:MAG TPA: hypothetical protein [Caudoviricetes sp.]